MLCLAMHARYSSHTSGTSSINFAVTQSCHLCYSTCVQSSHNIHGDEQSLSIAPSVPLVDQRTISLYLPKICFMKATHAPCRLPQGTLPPQYPPPGKPRGASIPGSSGGAYLGPGRGSGPAFGRSARAGPDAGGGRGRGRRSSGASGTTGPAMVDGRGTMLDPHHRGNVLLPLGPPPRLPRHVTLKGQAAAGSAAAEVIRQRLQQQSYLIQQQVGSEWLLGRAYY